MTEEYENTAVQGADKRKIITICGSSRFIEIMAVCSWLLERDEKAIVMSLHMLPGWYPNVPADHLAEHEGCAAEMDWLHLDKITLSDEIFVVNRGDYIGESTSNEIEHAQKLGKKVRWYTHDPVGNTVEKMLSEAQKK